MGRTATVVAYTIDPESGPQLKVTSNGGPAVTVDWCAPPGDDSPPKPGDTVVLIEATGKGNEFAIAADSMSYIAGSGEVRRYARNALGVPVAEFYLKDNGDITITSLQATGKIVLNGVEIDALGNVKIPGRAEAAFVSAAGVDLATHVHPVPGPVPPTGVISAPPTPVPVP